jgi:phospholipid-binding lipoprotein MlaA
VNSRQLRILGRVLTLGLSAAVLVGCASAPKAATAASTPANANADANADDDDDGDDASLSHGQKLDPWEKWNRKVFAFNEALDVRILKPVATGYRNVTPGFARTGVTNFFNNAADGWSAINCMLQGRFKDSLDDALRFATNTVFGLAGVLDIAGEMGFEHHYEDFGQTLGKWGIGAGAYIVWPVLGPSSVRESFALPLDRSATPAIVVDNGSQTTAITLLQIVNTRANLLSAGRVLDEIALDKYTFVRDAYLARRRSLVFDGDPPEKGAPHQKEKADDAAGSGANPQK